MPAREELIGRIRQIRSAFAESGEHAAGSTSGPGPASGELRALAARVSHLEQLVEGLQDSVHRESTRVSKRIGDLEEQIQPAALTRALSKDARDRGL